MQKKDTTLTTNRFVGQGILLFTDGIVISVTNWFYWIIVSRLASTSEIGQATSVYSLVLLIATISTLGLEYPLLKKSSLHRSQILGIALTIELIITSGSIVVIIFLANVYQTFLNGYILVAIAMLVLSPISFTARFALLGTLNARAVLVLDIIGTGAKFLAAYILLSIGFGALGILISFMIATLVTAITMTSIARRRLPLKLVRDKSHIIKVVKEGLSNMPSKLSKTMITTLSVILLASYGISNSDIGIFYIALMISVVGAGVASSMAYTVIPASTESKANLSSGSLRFGLSLTAPIVTGLIVAPKDILSILGSEYASADIILLVLSVAILPTAVISNAIAKFNNLGHDRKIIAIGIIQIAVFLTFLPILVPHYGSLGAAYSILISYTTSAALAVLFWFERVERKYIAYSVAAVIIGWICGYTINFMLDNSIPAIVLSVMATSVVLLALKNTSVSELRAIIRSINKSEAGQPHNKRSTRSE